MFTLKDFNVTRKTAKLSSGAKVVLFEKPNSPISLRVTFLGGAVQDLQKKEGTAHFLEHMLVAGTKSFPTKDKLAAYIEDVGGTMGATTSKEWLNTHTSVGDPKDLPVAVKLLSEELTKPLFDDKSIETERGSIKRELDDKLSRPTGALSEISIRQLFQGTAMSRSVLGSLETINSISKSDLVDYFSKHIVANNATFEVAGGVELSKLVDLLESEIKLPAGKRVDFDKEVPIVREKPITYKKFSGKSLNILIQFRTVNILHRDTRSLAILGSLLAGARSSSLTRLLRYERGLVYGVDAGIYSGADFGSFGIDTAISKDSLPEVLDIILKELGRIKQIGPTEEELNLVKNRLIKHKLLSLQTSADWVEFHDYRDAFYEDSSWTIEDYFKEVTAVTNEDIKRVANTYLTKDNWYFSATGDLDERELDSLSLEL